VKTPFVDRASEMRYLLELAERGSPLPLFIYGPEGCGKTRLLEELREEAKRRGYLVLYVDAKERDHRRALRGSSREIAEVALEVLTAAGSLGTALAWALARVIDLYDRRLRFRGRRVLLMVDEVVEGIGLSDVERYAKALHDLVRELVEERGAESVLAIATTSEGSSRELLSRHGYLRLSYLWNLDEASFTELARALGAPSTVVERVFELTSGNPRALIDIATLGWRTDQWLEALYAERVRPLRYERVVVERVRELEEAIEDPDALAHADPALRRLLVEKNMVMYLGHPLTPETRPRPRRGLGIGEEFAWQLNAYRILAKRLVDSIS